MKVIEYQGDRLSGIIKVQKKIDKNALNANKEMDEADKYESNHLKRVCIFTVCLFLFITIIIGLFLYKLKE